MRVSVIGGGDAPPDVEADAERVGELLAERGHTVVCGGYGGVMAAACRGARRAAGRPSASSRARTGRRRTST